MTDTDIIITDIVIIIMSKFMKLGVLGRTSHWISSITKVIMACPDKHFLSVVIMQELS